MKLAPVAIAVLVLNVPFGYWRANVRTFSLQWVLAVHLAIPFVIALRLESHVGFALYTYPALVTAYFLGQLVGGKVHGWLRERNRPGSTDRRLGSCLVVDLARSLRS